MSEYRPLSISGAWEVVPELHVTADSVSVEVCDFAAFGIAPLDGGRMYLSVSARNTLRGIHYAADEVKLATCVSGAVLDVVVDLRTDSPTYRQWCAVRLDDTDHRAVYLGEGLGHGYCVLSERATMAYLLSKRYDPASERTIHPFDEDLAIAWPTTDVDLSDRDRNAPSLREAAQAGLLPGPVGVPA